MRELQDFRVRYSDAGNATFSAREGAHDDLFWRWRLASSGSVARNRQLRSPWSGRGGSSLL